MFSGKLGRRTLTSLIAGAMLALAVPALAQTGRVQGKVVDDKDAPWSDAQILVTAIPDQGGQKWQAKSDKNGNYIIGTLPKSGQYLVVASKEGVGEDEARAAVKIGNFTTHQLQALARRARQRGAGQEEPGDQEVLRGGRRRGQCRQSSGGGRRVHRPRASRCPPVPTAISTSACRSSS